MRAREAGFTLLEVVVTVGITAILLAAGGFWMLAMRPGALRAATSDFDANLASARALAATSGNGATLVFAPQTNGAPGFLLRVYSGRPTAGGAVTATTTMPLVSAASVSEAHFGKPPFAIFLNSAGYPTGIANYPTLDAQGNPTFAVVAQQPPCPSGGIELTFANPQGVTATRTLACNTTIAAGTPAPIATPTPNAPHVSPTYLLAHDTSDSSALTFKAAEYGYYHWYASTANGAECQTIASDTGAAPATFASPWPYAQPSPASQGSTAPLPPALAPYTWPAGDPNDPPAWFALSTVPHNGGMCTVTVADDYGQSGTVTVQVMGDLNASQSSLTLASGQGAQTIDFSKTFDSQQLLLSAGGPCAGIVTVTTASGSFPSTPSSTPATAIVSIAPVGPGTCTLLVQDQYGEKIAIGVTVQQSISTWPQQLVLGTNGTSVGSTSGTLADAAVPQIVAFGPVVNALLAGGVARAASGSPCFALAQTTSGTVDASLPSSVRAALGIYVDSNGCEVDASDAPIAATSVGMIAYNKNGQSETYTYSQAGCPVVFSGWSPGSSAIQSLLGVQGQSQGTCSVTLSDGGSQTPTPDAGLVGISVKATGCVSGQTCAVLLTGSANSYNDTTHGTLTGYAGNGTMEFVSTDGGSSWTLVYSAFTDSQGTVTFTGSSEEAATPEFTGTWSDDPDVANDGLSTTSDIGTVTWNGSPPAYIIDATW